MLVRRGGGASRTRPREARYGPAGAWTRQTDPHRHHNDCTPAAPEPPAVCATARMLPRHRARDTERVAAGRLGVACGVTVLKHGRIATHRHTDHRFRLVA
eukprot:1844927-Prymnesium_polylepis.3